MRYQWELDADPGWTCDGQWEFGVPTGGGGQNGGPDPTSGRTGDNVYGYNLNGDYDSRMDPEYLTTGAIDCSELSLTRLTFWRWLGAEVGRYDRAAVEVSPNGATWSTVWDNLDEEIVDTEWVEVELDISEFADGEETVYVRWVMGETDAWATYCGWNIDDIEIRAFDFIPYAGDEVTALRFGPTAPNPFRSSATISFSVPSACTAKVSVYDVAGRLVKRLPDVACAAGPNQASWDGANGEGQSVASGVYFVRVTAGGESAGGKVVRLR